MSIIFPRIIILPGFVDAPTDTIPVTLVELQSVRIGTMQGCIRPISLCIGQNNDKNFDLYDVDTQDYTAATEIVFAVYNKVNSPDPALLTKTLTGGDITLLNPYTFRFSISNSESGAISKGVKYCEAWVVLSGGDQFTVGAGPFEVQDTRYFD